ncbi:MAG: thioredoxin family protein [Ignavibacteria bacterium]|nr:thioredoxin family protein [Ignavibacteria bacterium]
MNLKLIISDNCAACDRAKKVLETIHINNPNVSLETIHINSYHGKRISITPALFIDDKLFSYGDIDETRLNKKLN